MALATVLKKKIIVLFKQWKLIQRGKSLGGGPDMTHPFPSQTSISQYC